MTEKSKWMIKKEHTDLTVRTVMAGGPSCSVWEEEKSSYQLSYHLPTLTFSGWPGLLTGLGSRQDKCCQGRKQQGRTSIIKSQSLSAWPPPRPSSRSLRADLDGTASELVSPTRTVHVSPHPNNEISCSLFSLWFHLDFGCYLP